MSLMLCHVIFHRLQKPTPSLFSTAMTKCESAVKSDCPIESANNSYGRLMRCVVSSIHDLQTTECEDAITLNGSKKGIGHILSHETSYWRYWESTRNNLRRRDQEELTSPPTSSCGDAVFNQCGGICQQAGSAEEAEWFSCLESYIYDGILAECPVDLSSEADLNGEPLTDVLAWNFLADQCSWNDAE